MTNRRFAGLAALVFCLAMTGTAARAQSQSAPTPPAKPAPADDAKKSAFLAMSDFDRKAAQDALSWLGFYNGVVDGGFGKRTLDAIQAYQSSVKAPPDGMISAKQLTDLKAAAEKARAAIGFKAIDDPATGVRVGAPTKWLDKRTVNGTETRLSNRDGSITLDLNAVASGAGKLDDIYKRYIVEGPDRKITYKAVKPDNFFVVAGEAAGRKFYIRYTQAPAGAADAGASRGFIFTYPAADAKALDIVSLAIANSFDPFPAAGAKPAAADPAKATEPPPPPKPTGPVLTATALVIAQGQALTALREADCKDPTIDGKPVAFAKTDAPSGLALLSGELRAPATPASGTASGDLIALSLAPGASAGKPALEAINATAAPLADGALAVVAALPVSARGAPVFDRQGGLVALVGPLNGAPKRRGAVILSEPHMAIGGATLQAFAPLGPAPSAGEPLSAADLARRLRAAIVGVYCAP